MFHERVAVEVPKLNMSWTSVDVIADDGTSRYTGIHQQSSYQAYPKFQNNIFNNLLCCPALSPQITGTMVVDPLTWNVSVQVPTVGWAVVNDTKSNLGSKSIIK